MKHKIKIVIPYFGKFPDSINAFLLSCKKNPDFEWLFFTDDRLNEMPENVSLIKCTLSDIKKRIEKVVGFDVMLEAPYKLCDFRPAFGMVFSQELDGYDFWGWGDIDLVYGNLSRYITDQLLDQYDKVYPCGHLSLIRNTPENNRAFMLDVPGTLDYKTVFTDSKSFIFDEYKGLNEKLLTIGKRVYGCIDFADMDVVYHRFRTADWRTIRKVFPEFLYKQYIPQNYKLQTFYFENGKCYRVFYADSKVEAEELVYIHYRHKIPCEIKINDNSAFYVTNQGFINKNDEASVSIMQELNAYLGWKTELKEYLRFYKERCIIKYGSNKRLRNFIRIVKGKKAL